MVKANELRIGNWVNDIKGGGYNNPGFVKVRNIGSNGINSWQDMGASGSAEFEDIQPIALTPEILEKAGFVWNESLNHWVITWGKNGVHFIKDEAVYKGFGFQLGKAHYKIIHTLHQLQNLYFALTGEELTVNL